MSEKKKRVKFETKVYRAEVRKAEKESFRQLLSQDTDLSEDELSPDEIHSYKEQARVAAARLVEKGVNQASGTRAHPHST